ncbi:filamentous hemagglutinin N-terminal domain-containing protein [Salmonella enterica]
MNKIYKLKFDKRRNELVVVSEITAGMGKEKSTGHLADLSAISPFRKLLGTLTPLALLTGLIISLFPGMALANPDLPTGGQIVGGQGNISTSGNQMTIHQQTQNMATNWHSFDIGKNNTVQFVQPDSSSVALNRVTGASGSQIMGTLKANGQVFILNPNGVLFGKDARVNVAGLVASTKNINTADFMKGQYTLSGEGNPGSQVVNQGSLTTSKGGYIVLAGERVSNSGTVTTTGGKTVLAAGETVTLQLDNGGLTSVSVDGSVVNALVENRGLISASNGQVYLTAKGRGMLLNTVVNNSGTIEAKGLESRGGEIVLNGGDSGVVSQSGTLLADSHTGQGGKITLEGQNIHLAGNSLTSATGKTGGGEVYVGGGWQGKDSRIRNASKVVMDKTATVDVSATDAGNGGTAVLWSDDYTNFRGAVLAKGGSLSGNGGRVETSSRNNLQAFGDVDASAPVGKGGEWLLDPLDVTIVGDADNTGITETGKGTGGAGLDVDTDHTFSPSAAGAKVSATKISEQLSAGTSVTVDTHGDGEQQGNITVAGNASIKKTAGGDATLTLKADKNITFAQASYYGRTDKSNGSIVSTSAGGKLNLNLLTGNSGQDGAVMFGNYVRLHLNGGDALIGPANASAGRTSVSFSNDGSIDAGNITLNTSGGVTGNFYALNASGNLTVNGPLSVNAGYNITSELAAGNLLNITTDTGDIRFTATSTEGEGARGKILVSGTNGVNIRANNGHLFMNAVDKSKNTINISSSNGPVNISGVIQDGSDALVLTNVNISSKGQTTLNGTTYWGRGVVLSGLNITAEGDVDINGIAKQLSSGTPGRASADGVIVSGSNISSTGGNVSLSGFSGTDYRQQAHGAVTVSNSNITVDTTSGKILLNGTTESTTGLKITGSNLTAASMNITGVATKQGTGFSLTGSHLLGKLTDLTNVTLSSVGSAAGVTNALDSDIITDSNRGMLLAKRIENMTTVDMGGNAIFEDTDKDTKGWTKDYSLDDLPYHGWIFNNTSVTAGGDVSLKGAGFTNSTVSISRGNLTLDSSGPVPLTGTTITVSEGAVKVHSGAGNIDLNSGNISAKNDITLKAGAGSITVSGTNTTIKANITSTNGNISLSAYNPGMGSVTGINLRNTNITAREGNITVNGTTPGQFSGVRLQNIDMLANSENGVIDIYGESSGLSDTEGEHGSLRLAGVNNFSASMTRLHGENTRNTNNVSKNIADLSGAGLAFYADSGASADNAKTSFTGNVQLTGESVQGLGINFFRDKTWLSFSNGSVNITGRLTGEAVPTQGGTSAAIGTHTIYGRSPAGANIELNNSNLLITADATSTHNHKIPGFAATTPEASENFANGFTFTGNGNVHIIGKSNKAPGVNTRVFNNTGLHGNFTVEGSSTSGNGVEMDKRNLINLTGASIKGNSGSAYGVFINNTDGNSLVDLNNNVIQGTSITSDGINIKGSNVTITNGTLKGNATSGTGAGISLNGGSKYILDGVTITGQSADGAGVSVGGALTVNNGTRVEGASSGSGAGVSVAGTLTTESGDGVTLKGQSDSGDGVQVAGETSLNNATVNGTSARGIGTNIKGPLTVSGTSEIKGASTSGAGLNIADRVTVNEPDREKVTFTGISTEKEGVILGGNIDGGTVTGTSTSGDGVVLAENAVVKATTVKGSSTTGSGVNVTGNVKLDETTAGNLKASSVSGSGLTLSEGADVHVVQSSDMTTPVTAGKVLEGTSTTGSGVTVAGNASVSGAILKGNATAENGAGVTLKGGKLTLSDNISGVEAGATGNGNALVLDNAGVDAKGYRESTTGEKDYTLSATVTGDGTAVKSVGESTLTSVKLNATSAGNGSGLKVDGGTLTSDREITASSSGEQGTAVVLNGGKIKGTGDAGIAVTAGVTGGKGTAVKVTKNTVSGGGESTTPSSLENVNLKASSDKGTVLDVSGDLSSDQNISVSTTGGTALVMNGGGLTSADKTKPVTITASATGDTGTAVKVEKVQTTEGVQVSSSLKDVILVSSSTKGDALNVAGKLETQNAVLKTSTPDTGTALNISGGEIHSLGQTTLNATAETGHAAVITGGKLTGKGENALVLTATTTSANPAVDISGDSDISNGSVKGENKGTGTAVKQAGHTIMTNADVSGKSGSGTGAVVNGTVELADSGLNGTSETGTGSQVETGAKVTSTGTSVLSGEATGNNGKGTVVSGEISGGKVTGVATNGPALTLENGAKVKDAGVSGKSASGTGAVVNGPVELADSSLNGTTESGKGTVISGALTQDANSSVSGNSEGQGTGMQLESTSVVSGGILTATSVGGTGLQVEKGSRAESVVISAQTVTGKAIAGDDNALTANGNTSISTVGEPGNTNISGSVKPAPGGTPSGAVAEALGNKLSESIAALQKVLDTKLADLDGLQQTMTTLQMQFDQAVRTGAVGQADLKRLEMAVNGLSVRLHTAAELKDAFSALKGDTGSLEARQNKADALSTGLQALTLPAAGDISAVAGELGAAKTLQSATVSLQGSLATRAEEESVVRHLLDSLQQQLKDAQEKGTAGGTVLSGIQTQLESLGQQQRLYMEALARIRQGLATVSGDGSTPVAGRQESVNRLQTALSGVSGVSGIQVSELGRQLQRAMTGYAQLVATVQEQGSVNAQTPLQSREQQDSFHAGGEPRLPVHGYQAQPQNVDVSLCDSDGCRTMTLDAGKPSLSRVAAATESR